jgi:8-oxo-dGTP diphosphatase
VLDPDDRVLLCQFRFHHDADPDTVWAVAPGHASGYDGVVNDYYLVRTDTFTPRGTMTDEQLAAENVAGFRWWTQPEIANYRGRAVFSPRDLAGALAALLADGPPKHPLAFGL